MMKGTEPNKSVTLWWHRKRIRTPSRWANEPEKDIPTNGILAENVTLGEYHTRVPLLGNMVSDANSS